MKEDQISFAGDIPEIYDTNLGPILFQDYAVDIVDRVCTSYPSDVLELACGTGIVSRRLRDKLPDDSSIVATDLNEDMIGVAQKKFDAKENVVFQPADAIDLPFEDSLFDAVICQFGVMFFPDKDLGYREVRRVLKPGGKYHFNVWCSFEECRAAKVAQEVIEKVFENDAPGFYKLPFSYNDENEITGSLEKAGFSNIECAHVSTLKEVRVMSMLAKGLVFGNPLITEIRERDGVSAEEVEATLLEALCNNFGDNPGLIPMKALVFSATNS